MTEREMTPAQRLASIVNAATMRCHGFTVDPCDANLAELEDSLYRLIETVGCCMLPKQSDILLSADTQGISMSLMGPAETPQLPPPEPQPSPALPEPLSVLD